MIFRKRAGIVLLHGGVGLMIVNRRNEVWIGRRVGTPVQDGPGGWWQMPQGGIDEGEESYPAALRELREETNIRSVRKLGTIRSWLTYDIPPVIAGQAWKGKYRGQKQKWYALLFTGEDSEINIISPDGHKPEFIDWKWEPMKNLPDLVVPFKRDIYVRVVKEFSKFTSLTKHARK